jgi:hypothetical protein
MSIGRPEIDFPGGEPPTELEITDIWEGNGAEANPGDLVRVHYVGVAYSTGEEFDASWNRGRAGHEGRRPPSAGQSPGTGLRGPGRRDRHRAG